MEKGNPEKKYDVCIVGAGVAGATTAAYLGKHGKSVAIVERNLNERDVIVGELLQPGGVRHLKNMSLDFFLENMDAQPVYGYNIIFGNRNYTVKYPSSYDVSNGFGFRNGRFVQNMRKFILSLPNVDVFEGRVTSLLENDHEVSGFRFQPKGSETEQEIIAHLAVISDGQISRFRQQLSEPEIKVSGYFLGIIMQSNQLPHPNHGHLVIGDHPPYVLYPVNGEETRALIDFPGQIPPKFNDDFKRLVMNRFYSSMPDGLKPAFEEAVQAGGFKMMPNHRMPASPVFKKGAVLIGDSLNMRHPLTGGGMTCAFADIELLGSKLLQIGDFRDGDKLEKVIRYFYEHRHLGTQTINILADGLYAVVNHPDLRDAFFEYVSRGGKFADEPAALLGGLLKDKKLLQKHFFGVANFGTRLKINNEKGIRKIEGSYSLIREAVKIISPLLMSEKPDAATRLLLKTLANK
jgi:squalene monooxygenase